MATSMFSVGGLASGLDTDGIVNQLMAIERIPVTRYQQQQQSLKAVDSAWSVINTKLSGLRTALDGLSTRSSYDKHVSTTSSDATVVTATKTGSPSVGGISFTVDQLATRHQVGAGQALSGPDALVGAGSFTVTLADGSTKTVVTDGATTLSQLKDRINALSSGVQATVMQTAPGSHRLVLTASSTGAGAVFTVSQTPSALDNTQTKVLTQGVDARLTVGTGANAMVVTRGSNTITDLLTGVTLQLNKVSAAPVEISTSRDLAQTTKAVKDVVDSLKAVMGTIADYTKYDAASKTAGALQGNMDAKRMASDLRNALMTNMSGTYTSVGDFGIGFDRFGAVTFDETKLKAALEKDYEGVVGVLSNLTATSSDPRVTYQGSTANTVSGAYNVTITQAPDVAKAFSAAYTRPSNIAPHIFRVTSGATSVDVTLNRGTHVDVTTAVSGINTQLTAGGITNVRAVADAGRIRLEETRTGSAYGFSVTNLGTTTLWTNQSVVGKDIKGRIGADATEYTATNGVLTATTGAAQGLSVKVSVANGAAVPATWGTVTLQKGLLGILSDKLKTLEGKAGRVQQARDGITSQIDRLDDAIAAYELRLDQREVTLRRKFSALESALARSQSQGSWMASSIGTMNANAG